MRFALLFTCVLLGCGASQEAPTVYYEIKVEAKNVPQTAVELQPQVYRMSLDWVAARPMATLDLTGLSNRETASLLLRVKADDAGERIAVSVRLNDDRKQLVAVGGGQLALWQTTTLPLSLVPVSDARQKDLQLAKVVPQNLSSGRTFTLYGFGFSPGAQIRVSGQKTDVVSWLSSAELVARLPEGVASGPATIVINNPSGETDERNDLATAN